MPDERCNNVSKGNYLGRRRRHTTADFQKLGLASEFVQDNHSRTKFATLRGLHYQVEHPQGKLIRVIHGEIFDVAVDLRRSSATFGKCFSTVLSESNKLQLYIPPQFAHGFCALK